MERIDDAVGAAPSRVVPAKLRAPRLRADYVPRPRLLAQLGSELPRLTLISAPAGFGKTVLALEWLRQAQLPSIWLSLDPLDDDAPRFFAHLAAGIGTLAVDGAAAAAAQIGVLAHSGEGVTPQLLAALESLGDRVAIVFDDFHHLRSPALLELLRQLFIQLRGGPRVILLTREDPAFPLGRLRVGGELLEIRERDLRFTRAEAGELLARLLPDGLLDDLVARLHERTEGWVAGLRMAAIALQRAEDPAAVVESFAGTHRFVVDYLLEEAVGRQDAAVQRFLMETSILPRFTAEACVAVTGDPDARRLLAEVERSNLFLVALDESAGLFRYHHLFAELLEFRLRRLHPERVATLHERASAWFEAQGDLQEALHQASRIGTPDRLVRLLDAHGIEILARGDFANFAYWLRQVPDPMAQRFPMFLAACAWFRTQVDRAAEPGPLLAALEAALQRVPADYPESLEQEARWHLEALRGFALRVAGRIEEAVEVSERVLARIPPGAGGLARGMLTFNLAAAYLRLADMAHARTYLAQSFEEGQRDGIPYAVFGGLAHGGAVLAQTEGVARAREALEAAVAYAESRHLTALPVFALVLYQLGDAHLLAGEPARARPLLERAVALTAAGRDPDIHANSLIRLARVEADDGRFDEARARLAEAVVVAQTYNVLPFATTLEVERLRLAAIARDAPAGLVGPNPIAVSAESGERWSSWREAEELLRLEHCLRHGFRQEAAAAAERLIRESEPRGRGVALCAGRLAAAILEERPERRWPALDEALRFAAARGYVRVLLGGGAAVRAALQAALGQPLSPGSRAHARLLLDRLPARPTLAPPPAARLADPLTEREREVLEHLACSLSNKAIARAMFVSLDTVKTHLKHISAKLNVSGRDEAVARARELGLLPPAPGS